MTREKLPDRRDGETFELEYNWTPDRTPQIERVIVHYSINPWTRRVAEVFLDPLVYVPSLDRWVQREDERRGNTIRDAATLISVALQYGAALEVLVAATGHSTIELATGPIAHPHTLTGAVLRALPERQREYKGHTAGRGGVHPVAAETEMAPE